MVGVNIEIFAETDDILQDTDLILPSTLLWDKMFMWQKSKMCCHGAIPSSACLSLACWILVFS